MEDAVELGLEGTGSFVGLIGCLLTNNSGRTCHSELRQSLRSRQGAREAASDKSQEHARSE